MRRARAGAAQSPDRALARSGSTSPSRVASIVTPATDSSPISDAANRRPSSERTSTCRGRSSMASRIARRPPAAASRPCISTITRSAIRSTSLRTCELTMTVRPSAPSFLNRSMRCRRCTGSAPFNGSSSTSTCGSVTSAAAILVRWRIPLLNPSTRRSAASSMATLGSAASGALAIGDAVEVGDVADELSSGEPGGHGLVLGHQRHARVHLAIAARVAALDAHGALVDADESGHRPHQRRLAGAVRPEQSGHARTERATELRQRDLRPEPHRHVGDLDGRVGGERRVVLRVGARCRRGGSKCISVPPIGIDTAAPRAHATARRGRSRRRAAHRWRRR